MNRKARRAAAKGEKTKATAPPSALPEIDHLVAEARTLYRQGQFALARDVCRRILAREPSNVVGHGLLGAAFQALNQHEIAVKHFAKAIALDDGNASVHYNIAVSYQKLRLWTDAETHFTRAIALNLDGMAVEQLVLQNPVVDSCLDRVASQWPRPMPIESMLGPAGIAAIADDVFLRCALENVQIGGQGLEFFLTSVRYALLQLAVQTDPDHGAVEERALRCYTALARQCFINEYVFDSSDDETRQADGLRQDLLHRLTSGSPIPALLLVAVAAYFPLHRLPVAEALWNREWPAGLGDLLRQQVFEPLEEYRIRTAIPALTGIDDDVSAKVKQQYEENPFPRWTIAPHIADDWRTRFDVRKDGPGHANPVEILVAGCGTGQNPIQTARTFPNSRVLAVDLSLASLAYAQRKTREAGISNIDYAQADILQLGSIARNFDRIESLGVLHHLADPKAGWRVLLSLLRAGGIMDVGLYSETARRSIVAARDFIKERGYAATADDIRRFRRDVHVSKDGFATDLLTAADFYNTSGCRDLLFHVEEHKFDIPDIAAFLADNGLQFLGFRAGPQIIDRFRSRYPAPQSLTDLECWHSFEQAHPQTFIAMYRFAVRKLD